MRQASPPDRIAPLLPELYALRPSDEFPVHALRIACRAVGGDKADYTELDLVTGDVRVIVEPEPPQLDGLRDARRA
jgi:hypothetical protein